MFLTQSGWLFFFFSNNSKLFGPSQYGIISELYADGSPRWLAFLGSYPLAFSIFCWLPWHRTALLLLISNYSSLAFLMSPLLLSFPSVFCGQGLALASFLLPQSLAGPWYIPVVWLSLELAPKSISLSLPALFSASVSNSWQVTATGMTHWHLQPKLSKQSNFCLLLHQSLFLTSLFLATITMSSVTQVEK